MPQRTDLPLSVQEGRHPTFGQLPSTGYFLSGFSLAGERSLQLAAKLRRVLDPGPMSCPAPGSRICLARGGGQTRWARGETSLCDKMAVSFAFPSGRPSVAVQSSPVARFAERRDAGGIRRRLFGFGCDQQKRLQSISALKPKSYRTRPKGLEPSTFGSTVRCSNQLSYGPVFYRNATIVISPPTCQRFLKQFRGISCCCEGHSLTRFFVSSRIEPGNPPGESPQNQI
jgi:hypothetical protein